MISKNDAKVLRKMLAMAADPDESLSNDELRGFLFGLSITPDLVLPSEWLPKALTEQGMAMPSSVTSRDGQTQREQDAQEQRAAQQTSNSGQCPDHEVIHAVAADAGHP